MNGDHGEVPILGRTGRLAIVDFAILAPNMVAVVPNGLDMGESVCHLRITNPIKASQAWVPLTGQQVSELVRELVQFEGHHTHNPTQED